MQALTRPCPKKLNNTVAVYIAWYLAMSADLQTSCLSVRSPHRVVYGPSVALGSQLGSNLHEIERACTTLCYRFCRFDHLELQERDASAKLLIECERIGG